MHTYTIHDRIGRGGMAEIFLGVQTGLGGFERLVVFKRIAPFARADEEYVRSFLREARVAASTSHPNIVTTLDVGEDADGPYLVMEYLSGEPLSWVLRQLREREILLPLPLACQVAASLASALDLVHNLTLPDGTAWPVVHRDVSPSNVMCCYSGQVKLLDFGVAKLVQEDPTQVGKVKGKVSYMSPEQVHDQLLGPRSDIFQLGIVFWEMLAGRRLFSRDAAAAVQAISSGAIPRPSEVASRVPPELDRLVAWALQVDVDRRCPSARAFVDRLQEASPDLAVATSGRAMSDFMTRTFPERHQQRLRLERRTREAPPDLAELVEVNPSITSRTPTPAGSFAPPLQLAPEPLPEAQPDRTLVTAFVLLSLATLTAVLAGVVGLLLVIGDAPPPKPAGLEPIPRADPPTSSVPVAAPAPLPAPAAPLAPRPASVAPEVPAQAPATQAGEELAPFRDEVAPEPVPDAPREPASGDDIDIVTDNLDPWEDRR